MTNDRDDLARLPIYDISPRRARELRRRCHAMLTAAPPPQRGAWRTYIVPTLGGAWCLAYLIEIIRCAEVIHRFFGISLTSR
jgi:hypothetical protein